ncbi:MAG: hypothetical protein RLZZ480_41 [Candidatus Parcubacteria bacterium]|jgi:hypothetical protein
MTYYDEVQKECDRQKIPNPIQEEDPRVAAVSFQVNGNWIHIEGTNMNRAGRLFFQGIFGGINHTPICTKEIKPYIIERAKKYFSENWLDAEIVGRPMLIAFKQATHFAVYWK